MFDQRRDYSSEAPDNNRINSSYVIRDDDKKERFT